MQQRGELGECQQDFRARGRTAAAGGHVRADAEHGCTLTLQLAPGLALVGGFQRATLEFAIGAQQLVGKAHLNDSRRASLPRPN